ncbi:MAG TPA: hypothetical protein VIB07_09020 [Nitrososphaera sp.]
MLEATLPKLADRVAGRLLVKGITGAIVQPILDSKTVKTAKTFDDSISSFTTLASALSDLIIRNNADKLSYIVELEKSFYDSAMNYRAIPNDLEATIVETIKVFEDYQRIIFGVVEERSQELTEVVKQLDLDDCITSLYGTLLAIICIIELSRSGRSADVEKLKILVELGKKYSDDLDTYIDTLDVLSNPKEIELIKKSNEKS